MFCGMKTVNPSASYLSCRDVTERKKSEEALYESEGKFRSLVEKSMVGVYLLQDNLFRYVNAKFAEIFGYETEEIIDRLGPQEVIFPDDRPLVEEKVEAAAVGRDSIPTLRIPHQDQI